MNKYITDIIVLGVITFIIFLPTLINDSSIEKKTDTFFQRVDRDFDDCVKNANEDAANIDWCKKIKRSSELSFNSATRVSDSNSNIFITQAILFALAAIILNFKRRIESLENK